MASNSSSKVDSTAILGKSPGMSPPMSTSNQEFNNIDRPAYEIPKLIARLGMTRLDTALTSEQYDLALAVERHAENATTTILSGLEALGQALACAMLNPNWQPSPKNFHDLGHLVSYLAVEAQSMHDTAEDMRCDLTRSEPAQPLTTARRSA